MPVAGVTAVLSVRRGRRLVVEQEGQEDRQWNDAHVARVAAREVAAFRQLVLAADREVDRMRRPVGHPLQRRLRRAWTGELRDDRAAAKLVTDHIAGDTERRVLCGERGEVRGPIAAECARDRLVLEGEHLGVRDGSRRAEDDSCEERVDCGVAVVRERGEPRRVRCRNAAPSRQPAEDLRREHYLSFDEGCLELGPCDSRPIAEGRVSCPEVDTRGGGLVRVDAGRAVCAPTP